MNAQEFKTKHMDGDEVYDAECVFVGPDEIYHKTVSQTSVYQLGEQFFEVTSTRDNSGYWSDGERYDPEVREVKPRKVVVEQTVWDAI